MCQEIMPSQGNAGRIMGQALASQARRHTYCLIHGSDNARIGTAVAVKLGERHFLATVAHMIEGDTANIQVILHNQVAVAASHFVARHYDLHVDVGLLEVSASDAHRFNFVEHAHLLETIEDHQELPAMVVGFPGQFCAGAAETDLTTNSLLRVIFCNSLSYHTVVLPMREWPADGLPDENCVCQTLTEGRDMLVDFQDEQEVRPFTPQSCGSDNPPVECPSLDPHGMSGGGIWLAQVGMGREQVSWPDARLIGLQISWHRTRNLLRGVRIGAWLDLVREKYADLRDTI